MNSKVVRMVCACFVLLGTLSVRAQVTTIPAMIQKGYDGEVTVIFNPNEGNKGMVGATECYAHTGVTYGGESWQHTGEWRDGQEKYKMTKTAEGTWELKIAPSIYSYYGVPEGTEVEQLCFVFNDGPEGSKEGKNAEGGDIFVNLVEAGLAATIQTSMPEIASKGTKVTLTCQATTEAEMVLTLNGEEVKKATGKTMEYSYTLAQEGNYQFVLTAKAGEETATAEVTTCVPAAAKRGNRPAGVLNGIYYDEQDDTKVTLCTYAGSKTEAAKHVFVVGDFNDWKIDNNYQMTQANDSAYFWLTIDGLEPGKEYAMQYVVVRADGKVKYISDLYSEKLLHPDDQYEPRQIDPDLMPYPAKGKDYVTVIQTNKPAFAWSEATLNFKRPDKNNLIIYELWVYDHTAYRSIEGILTERLDYLQHLGVNAIELMPVNEFDGNQNWGYSPNHYFALDKAYGTPEQLKTLVDECHKRGIAVILDMVFNHGTGLNPMNKLYPYGEDLKHNPWYNVSAPHPDNVYEDWNHDFEPAQAMFTRALRYWLQEYKIDGYRMDLSHGLCGATDNAVSHIKNYYKEGVKAVSEDAYFILEHWGTHSGQDRPELIKDGMLCWVGNHTCKAYEQTAMGWLKDGDDLNGANVDGYVSYPENHDEERAFFKAKQWGNADLQTDEAARVARVPLNMAFLTLLNGPHLFYHFAELGYDYSKFQNARGQWGKDGEEAYGFEAGVNEEVKMQPKRRPEDMGWFKEGSPRMAAYQKTAQAIQLRTRLMPEVFEGNPTASLLGSGKSVRSIQWGADVLVVGNFSATDAESYSMPNGTWFDYYANNGSKASGSITLQPGELKIYTGEQVSLPEVPDSFDFKLDIEDIEIEDIEAGESVKIMYEGQIYIIRNGVWYDLMGRVVRR